MALDSKLILELSRFMERAATRLEDHAKLLEKLVVIGEKQNDLLEQIHLELLSQNEALDAEPSSGDRGDEDDDDDEDDEDDSRESADDDDEDGEWPSFVPAEVRAEFEKKKRDPTFWLGLVGKAAKVANGSAKG